MIIFRKLSYWIIPHRFVQILKKFKQTTIGYRLKNKALNCQLQNIFPDKKIIRQIVDRRSTKSHFELDKHIQFWYASNRLARLAPEEIYDIGSHRSWLLGVGASIKIHSLDVRENNILLENQTNYLGKAEQLPWKDNSVDCVTSLCSLEHFGLGSYGDDFDPFGDIKALSEMKRVLRSGGDFIFTTTLTGGDGFIVFNTRRIYSLEDIHAMLSDEMRIVDEVFFSRLRKEIVPYEKLIRTFGPYDFDLYMGHWKRG
jgi:SAM-dependent methyltransferase